MGNLIRQATRVLTVLVALFGPMAGGTAAQDSAAQVQWVGDVPINPALQVEPGLGFAFDSPEGRVVMIFLSGAVDEAAMQAYYRAALPPLGWEEVGAMRWSRQGDAQSGAQSEALRIDRTEAAGTTLWKIMLRPE